MICPKCGAENRESAKFCLKCAHQLVALWEDTVQAEPRKRKRRKRRPDESAQAPRAGVAARIGPRTLIFAALLLAVVAAAVWRSGTVEPEHLAAAPSAATPAAPAPTTAPMQPPALPTAPVQAVAKAADPPPARTPEPALSPPAAPVAKAQAPHAEPAARSKPKPARAAAPKTAPPVSAPAAPPPEPVAAAPAPAPASAPSAPKALCEGSRFIALEICLQRECSQPGARQNPQCVRMRERQQALSAGSGNR